MGRLFHHRHAALRDRFRECVGRQQVKSRGFLLASFIDLLRVCTPVGESETVGGVSRRQRMEGLVCGVGFLVIKGGGSGWISGMAHRGRGVPPPPPPPLPPPQAHGLLSFITKPTARRIFDGCVARDRLGRSPSPSPGLLFILTTLMVVTLLGAQRIFASPIPLTQQASGWSCLPPV